MMDNEVNNNLISSKKKQNSRADQSVSDSRVCTRIRKLEIILYGDLYFRYFGSPLALQIFLLFAYPNFIYLTYLFH